MRLAANELIRPKPDHGRSKSEKPEQNCSVYTRSCQHIDVMTTISVRLQTQW